MRKSLRCIRTVRRASPSITPFLFADVTPTAIAFREGNMYVGNLNIFPVRTETARVTTFSKNVAFLDTTPGLETKAADLNKFRVAGVTSRV